jgi:putative membrane protein
MAEPCVSENDNPADKGKIMSNDEEKTRAWQSLSPIALLYFAISFLRQVVSQFVVLIPALLFTFSSLREHPFIGIPVLITFIALWLGVVIWRFRAYRFRLSNDSVEIRSGLLQKSQLNLPFARIQNVKLEQPIYYRLSGYACLQLDTAGSSKQEARLIALPLGLAVALKEQILAIPRQPSQSTNTTNPENTLHPDNLLKPANTCEAEDAHEIMLIRRSLSDLVIYGISNKRVWLVLGGLVPFYDRLKSSLVSFLQSVGIDISQLLSVKTQTWWQFSVNLILMIFLFTLLMMCISVLLAIVNYYGFTLSKKGKRYIRRSGLLNHDEVSMGQSRVQMLVQQQDALDRLFQRCHLSFSQNSAYSGHNDSHNDAAKIMVPALTALECQQLIDDVYPLNHLKGLQFQTIHRFFIVRYAVYLWLPLCIVLGILAMLSGKVILASCMPILWLVGFAAITLRWRRWGIAYDKHYMYVRSGWIGVQYRLFPSYKIQQAQFKQSIFMRHRHLAGIKFVLASGSIVIPMLNEDLAYNLVNRALYQAEASQRSWM